LLTGSLLAASRSLSAQQSANPAYTPKQSDRPEPLEGDEAGFASIFNGKTLDGFSRSPTSDL
jgi:hypothetical protein